MRHHRQRALSGVDGGSYDEFTWGVWNFDGTLAADHGPDFAISIGTAPAFGTGMFGQAFEVDTADSIEICCPVDANFPLQGSGDFTFEFWIKSIGNLTNSRVVSTVGSANGFQLLNRNFQDPADSVFVIAEAIPSNIVSLKVVGVHTTPFLNICFERHGNNLYQYHNGVLVNTVDVTGKTLVSADNFCLGQINVVDCFFDSMKLSTIARYQGVSFPVPTEPY